MQVGLWIDHRKAVTVTVTDAGHTTAVVESNAERNVHYTDTSSPGVPKDTRPTSSEDTRERHFAGQMQHYYDEVITHLAGADAILIFGPGEAKGELWTRLEHRGLGARVVGVEAADRMTDHQIVAKVRERLPQ